MRTNKYVVDRVSASRLGLLTGFTTAVAVCLWGVSVSADVIDIDLTGNQSGSVEASRRFFVPGDSPEAHFNTPTGAFDEQVFGQGAPIPGSKGVAWWDVEFKVTRTPDQTGDEMITIDKVVTNFTGVKWRDFHVTLGRGVDPDYVLSLMWLSLAASTGWKPARIGRDEVAGLLSPAQIEEAQRLAREWRPKATTPPQ